MTDGLIHRSLPSVEPAKFSPLRAQPLAAPRYLLFDAATSASLHDQQRTLLFFLELAIALGRTLVLPRCRLRRLLPDGQPVPDSVFVPWSELFDQERLAALHPAVGFDVFVASHGQLDLLARAAPATCAPTTVPEDVGFNGLPALRVLRSECGIESSVAALRTMPHAAIGFAATTRILETSRAARLRPHVRFERSVYTDAVAFARQRLAAPAIIEPACVPSRARERA